MSLVKEGNTLYLQRITRKNKLNERKFKKKIYGKRLGKIVNATSTRAQLSRVISISVLRVLTECMSDF